MQTTTQTPKPLLSAFVTKTESNYNLPFLLPSLRHTTKIPASTCSYLMAALPVSAYSKQRQRIWFLRASSQVSAEFGSAPKIFPSYLAPTPSHSHCTSSQRAKASLCADPNVSCGWMGLHFHCCPQSLLHAQFLA